MMELQLVSTYPSIETDEELLHLKPSGKVVEVVGRRQDMPDDYKPGRPDLRFTRVVDINLYVDNREKDTSYRLAGTFSRRVWGVKKLKTEALEKSTRSAKPGEHKVIDTYEGFTNDDVTILSATTLNGQLPLPGNLRRIFDREVRTATSAVRRRLRNIPKQGVRR